MNRQNQQPSFIRGLLEAKSLLVSLRQKKLGEQQQTLNRQPVQQFHAQSPKTPAIKESKVTQQEKQPQIISSEQGQRQRLIKQINNIGKDLYENTQQIESEELLFQRLAEYYGQNIGIVQENERLKRKSYKYSELINFYRQKVELNYKIVEQQRENEGKFVKIVEQTMQQYLKKERQRSCIEVLPILQLKREVFSLDKPEDEQKARQKVQIELNWKNLGEATQKKTASKKSKVLEEDLIKSFYTSQIYNI